MELRVRHIARNAFFSWFGTIVNMAVGFFLSPFILHRLGDIAYGIWVLAVSTVGYLTLLDFGMQGSILRFVSQGHTKGDHESASEAASAALWMRLQISAAVILLSVGLAVLFPFIFKVPSALTSDARKAIVLIGLTTAVTMSFGVVGGIISALNRYDLQNYVGILQTSLRAGGIVYVLRSGHGIVAIALCELASTIVGRLTQLWVAKRIYPELRLRIKTPKRETLKKIWTYSIYAFFATVAVQLIYQSDALVVGAFISATAVTFYAIANSLCRYANQLISSMSGSFMPAASTFEAAGDSAKLVALYKNGTRALLIISLPVMLTLILRGSTFIGLWMGQKYAHVSGGILIILAVPLFFSFANQTASSIAFGTEKHRTVAIWSMGEGAANLTLSVILLHFFGIYGVAIGTLIPSLITQFGFWPRYTSRLTGVPPSQILLNVWSPVILAGIPFAAASYAWERLLPPHSLGIFFVQVFATLPVFFLTIALVFRGFISTQVVPRIRSLFFARAV